MAPNYRDLSLRLAAAVSLAVATLILATAAGAMTRIEVFQASVPVTDRSEAAHAAAFQAALRVVMVRATGRRSADEDAVFAPLVNNARRYVQQFRAAPDNQLWVSFDGAAIERWLIQNGQPTWGRDRPSTFVWVTVPAAAGALTVLSADDTSELKVAIDAAAAQRGLPLIWPNPDAAAGNGNPADVARRLGADGVLLGRASSGVASAVVRWTFQFQDHGSEFSGLLEGVNRAADLYAGLYAASGNLAPLDIDVSGVGDLKDYAAVQTYLESLAFVTHVGVDSLSGDTVRFRLTARGGSESLQRAIALNGRLQTLPAGEGGIQRFQLRR